jgi:hypothetical protein
VGFDDSVAALENEGLGRELARWVAEAQIDLRRIRRARDRLLCNASNDPNAKKNVALSQELALILSQQTKQLLAMDRYERGALLRRKRAIRAFDETACNGCRFYKTKPK